MTKIPVCVMCMFLIFLAVPAKGEIDEKVDPGVWQAEQIDAQNKVFLQEEKKLDGLTSSTDITKQKEKIQAAQDILNKTIQGYGFKGISSIAVLNAQSILNRRDTIKELTNKIGDPKNANDQSLLEIQKAEAISELEQFIIKVKGGGQRRQNLLTQQELLDLAESRFRGFGFGVAIAGIFKAGNRDQVQDAIVDSNNIVRIERDNNSSANFILESHYFFKPTWKFVPQLFNVEADNWGHGPFVAVQPGTDNIIEALGIGWMVGFKRSTILATQTAKDLGDSFNLGAGILVDPNAKVLGDGIVANQPLPSGESDIRLKTTTELSWLFLFSYSF